MGETHQATLLILPGISLVFLTQGKGWAQNLPLEDGFFEILFAVQAELAAKSGSMSATLYG